MGERTRELESLVAEAERLRAEVEGLRAERDKVIEACICEVQYRLHPRGEVKHGWRWVVGERSGIAPSRETAEAAVRAAIGLGPGED